MKILHVIYDDVRNPWLAGGGAIRTHEIYSRIGAKGHTVVVVCGSYPGAKRREIVKGVRYRRVGVGASYIVSRLTFMAAAARMVRHGGYDIVVEDFSPYSPVVAPLWKRRGVPAVASIQNLSGAHASEKYGLAGWGPRLIERPALSAFKDFVVVSPGIKEDLLAELGSSDERRINIVPNGVDPVFLLQERVAQTGRYILFLGRIDIYQKGLDTLIQAFDTASRELEDVQLIIGGGGTASQEARLRELIENAESRAQIMWGGPVPKDEAARLAANALFLAMPSRYEAWPLTALEAGAAGIPVVGFDITGISDAAPSYPRGHGLLVRAGDVHELVEKMVKVARDEQLRRDAGDKGRQWAQGFTWESMADEQLAFYEEVITGTAQRSA